MDHVAVFARHDEEASRHLVQWADVVFCEWCSPVAIWYSRNKRPGQRLVVRLHRMELYNDWTEHVDIDNVNQVVCVSPHYARLTLAKTGWPADKVVCIPNYVDAFDLDRPKLPGARFGIGFIGIVPARKRLDLAFDVLERLRRRDPRYTLFVKSKMPWDYPWNWRRKQERDSIRALLGRVQATPVLREAVVFDKHGPDVSAWLRKIGFVLSTSDDESFHVGPAEGMCSGALPSLLPWPGSETIYDRRWIHDDVDAMADDIHSTASGSWESLRRAAKRQAEASFDIPVVAALIERVLVEDLPVQGHEICLSVPLRPDGSVTPEPGLR
jgi:glycosyltransferase involved in cell wall biosynthesis